MKNGLIGLYDIIENKISSNIVSIEKAISKNVNGFVEYYAVNQICSPRYIFPENDIDNIINLFGFEVSEFQKEIKNRSFNENFKVLNEKNSIVLLFLMRYYKSTYKVEKAKSISLLLTYIMFSRLLYKYFKSGCSIDVMSYTISNLSGYFLLGKNEGDLLKTLANINESIYSKYEPLLTEASDDKKFIDYTINLRTRVNAILQNTADAYYKVFNEKLYISANKAVTDTDSGENIADFRNNNDFVTKVKLNLKDYITKNNEDKLILQKISNATSVKIETINEMFLLVIKDDKSLEELANVIFKTLGSKLNNQICSRSFVLENMRLLSSKYNDNAIKPKVDEILSDKLYNYKSSVSSTQSRYKRALLLIILLYIQKSNCRG